MAHRSKPSIQKETTQASIPKKTKVLTTLTNQISGKKVFEHISLTL